MKKWKFPKANKRRRREMWWKLLPQQVIVMLWMKVILPVKVHRSLSGRSWGVIGTYILNRKTSSKPSMIFKTK
ncbi:hypothetical protein AB205_0210630 [Aquarana catesbeiana]|uniref:Uncharacterized protein n=1 Tax=Aquarana catesbeiana TaxID=8400 RepID=A0A2G9P4Q2_AQUCT|nr:hypothetical protein AB205_0210630 [Aquarana catesbeiana]